MANVFISHRSNDSKEAELLADEIRKAGHNVWLDLWAISFGDSIVEKMNEGLEGATYVILCYSSADITSPWMGREWYSTLARQLNGVGVKLLPVKLTGGKPPAILADIKYVDLMKDWSHGISQLLNAIK
jgi:hypothetical protein